MNVLLVAATAGEVETVFKHLGGVSMPKAGDPPFSLRYGKLDVDFLVTGIGMVPTTYATARALALKKYDLAVNAGIGGGSSSLLVKSGRVFHVVSERFPEVGAEDGSNKLTLTAMGLPGDDDFPFSAGVLVSPKTPPAIAVLELPTAAGRTVNLVTGSAKTEQERSAAPRIEIESMEGGGFFYACLKENVPFAEIRSVSNQTGPRDRNAWKIPEAITALNKTLIQLFDHLSQ